MSKQRSSGDDKYAKDRRAKTPAKAVFTKDDHCEPLSIFGERRMQPIDCRIFFWRIIPPLKSSWVIAADKFGGDRMIDFIELVSSRDRQTVKSDKRRKEENENKCDCETFSGL